MNNNELIQWVAEAKKAKETEFLIVKKDSKEFPHYKIKKYGLWDTAVILEKKGYEIIDFVIYEETFGVSR